MWENKSGIRRVISFSSPGKEEWNTETDSQELSPFFLLARREERKLRGETPVIYVGRLIYDEFARRLHKSCFDRRARRCDSSWKQKLPAINNKTSSVIWGNGFSVSLAFPRFFRDRCTAAATCLSSSSSSFSSPSSSLSCPFRPSNIFLV